MGGYGLDIPTVVAAVQGKHKNGTLMGKDQGEGDIEIGEESRTRTLKKVISHGALLRNRIEVLVCGNNLSVAYILHQGIKGIDDENYSINPSMYSFFS